MCVFLFRLFVVFIWKREEAYLSTGRSDSGVELPVVLQNTAQLWSDVALRQPGASQQSLQVGLEVQQQLIHDQSASLLHSPLQSSQGPWGSSGESTRGRSPQLPLKALGGVSGDTRSHQVFEDRYSCITLRV